MTAIVGAALGVRPLPTPAPTPATTGQFLLAPGKHSSSSSSSSQGQQQNNLANGGLLNGQPPTKTAKVDSIVPEMKAVMNSLFERNTKAIIWGQQTRAIQVYFYRLNIFIN
jgi:ATP citrate (pro-S)-lyase